MRWRSRPWPTPSKPPVCPLSDAERLAAWMKLGVAEFRMAYASVADPGLALRWTALEAKVLRDNPAAGRDDLILEACRHADAVGFINKLAVAVANIEAEFGYKTPTEVGALLEVLGGAGVMQAMTNRARALMDASILRSLVAASEATAIVYQDGAQLGTAFLVSRDLVLTAGHVVLEIDSTFHPPRTWKTSLRQGLTFSFSSGPKDSSRERVEVPAAVHQEPFVCAEPHGRPVNILNRSLASPAGSKLDYALVRLARQVDHVSHLDISTPNAPEQGRTCFVLGYPGGNNLMFDADTVTEVDPPSGRLLHLANAAPGMSGGCCVGADGSIVALHEGAIQRLKPDGSAFNPPQYSNRGVCLSAIRNAQRAGGKDPLMFRPAAPGVEFSDPQLVEALFRTGLRLGGPDLETSWRTLFELLVLGRPPSDDVPMPPFYPWLRRGDVERWIDGRAMSEKICHVGGPEGAGKSFCAQIVRGKLDQPTLDLVALRPTQIGAWSWEEALGSLENAAFATRPSSGTTRYESVPDALAALSRRDGRARTPNAPLFVVLDFGTVAEGMRLESSPWLTFIEELARADWTRLMLIGLAQDERDRIDDLLVASPITEMIRPPYFELPYLGEIQLREFARSLAEARGLVKGPSEIRGAIDPIWRLPNFRRAVRPALQTAEAVLAAIAFERGL
jgi:Trypsin-like peptidase domain